MISRGMGRNTVESSLLVLWSTAIRFGLKNEEISSLFNMSTCWCIFWKDLKHLRHIQTLTRDFNLVPDYALSKGTNALWGT